MDDREEKNRATALAMAKEPLGAERLEEIFQNQLEQLHYANNYPDGMLRGTEVLALILEVRRLRSSLECLSSLSLGRSVETYRELADQVLRGSSVTT